MSERFQYRAKSLINQTDYNWISNLERYCHEHDRLSFKLEQDYKLKSSQLGKTPKMKSDFFCYCNQMAVGYLGIAAFGGAQPPELNGLVLPEYRRQGIFTRLFALAGSEMREHEYDKALLLCDHASESGTAFIAKIKGRAEHAELELSLAAKSVPDLDARSIKMVKATNADSLEIYRQDKIFRGEPDPGEISKLDDEDRYFPESEAEKGVEIYLALLDGKPIGKIHLASARNIGWIYGFGVKPEYRRKGYGLAIMGEAIRVLRRVGNGEIRLQVDNNNLAAFRLYHNIGFQIDYRMNYYEWDVPQIRTI